MIGCVGSNPIESSAQGIPVLEATNNSRLFNQQEIDNWKTNAVPLSDILLAKCEFPINAGYNVSAYYVIKSHF